MPICCPPLGFASAAILKLSSLTYWQQPDRRVVQNYHLKITRVISYIFNFIVCLNEKCVFVWLARWINDTRKLDIRV